MFKLKQIKFPKAESPHLTTAPFPTELGFPHIDFTWFASLAGRGELHVFFSLLRRNTPHCHLD